MQGKGGMAMSDQQLKKQTVFKNGGEEEDKMEKTGSGLNQNLAGLLAYIAGIISGVIFLLIEKENQFVRFHAYQSIMVTVGLLILSIGLSFVPIVGWILSLLLSPIGFILWIVCMYKAYQGEIFKVPIVGNMAASQAGLK